MSLHMVVCPTCDATGWVPRGWLPSGDVCPDCGGSGEVTEGRRERLLRCAAEAGEVS